MLNRGEPIGAEALTTSLEEIVDGGFKLGTDLIAAILAWLRSTRALRVL